jgi:hypothetical protein
VLCTVALAGSASAEVIARDTGVWHVQALGSTVTYGRGSDEPQLMRIVDGRRLRADGLGGSGSGRSAATSEVVSSREPELRGSGRTVWFRFLADRSRRVVLHVTPGFGIRGFAGTVRTEADEVVTAPDHGSRLRSTSSPGRSTGSRSRHRPARSPPSCRSAS